MLLLVYVQPKRRAFLSGFGNILAASYLKEADAIFPSFKEIESKVKFI